MTEPVSDAALLRAAGAGDRVAFTELVERHADPVYRFLRSLGAASADAEDALQDCFVSAWRSAKTFAGADSARGWLYSIARNALRRQYRRRVGQPQQTESLEELGAEAGWGSQSDFLPRLEAVAELEWAFAQLPPEEREIVILRDLEGFSGPEASEALGITTAAMKSRLHRGRLRLMGVLRGGEASRA